MDNSRYFLRRVALLSVVSLLLLTLAVSGVSAAPGTFNLVTPANESSIADPSTVTTMTWEVSDTATEYTLTVDRPDPAENLTVTGTPDDDGDDITCDATTCTATVNGGEAFATAGVYSWTVSATDGSETVPAANAPFTFTVEAAAETFSLLTPANNTNTSDPATLATFTWEEYTGATSYTFTLDRPVAENLDVIATPDDDGDALTCAAGTCTLTITPASDLPDLGAYSWTVSATDGGAPVSADNAPFTFTIEAAPTFNLLTPANGITINDPTTISAFTWEEFTGATSYTFLLDRPVQADLDVTATPEADGDALTCESGTCTLLVIGGAELADEGNYSWTVSATDGGTPVVAGNAPFTFIIDLLGPGAFELASPDEDSYLRSKTVEFSWSASVGAESYQFLIFQVSSNVERLGTVVDEPLTPAQAACDGDAVCTYSPDLSAVTDGQFAWTVVASNPQGEVEASNGAWHFIINTGAIELVVNGGFEQEGLNKKTPANWNRPAANASGKRVCNAAVLPTNVSGLCAMKGTAATGAMVQRVDSAFIQSLGLTSTDTLTVSAQLQANNPPAAASRIIIQFKGAGKVVVPLEAAAYDGNFNPLTGSLTNIALPANVATATVVKIKIVSASKFFLDDLSILVNPTVVPPLAGDIPVPGAP